LRKTIICGLLSLGTFLGVASDSTHSFVINNLPIEVDSNSQQAVTETTSPEIDVIAQPQEVPDLFVPVSNAHRRRTNYAYASWYRHGRITANGERYDPNGLTVAHKRLPFNTMVRFTNPENGRSVIARVNDRGPYIRGRDFDLSMRSAQLLGFYEKGVVRLEVEIIR